MIGYCSMARRGSFYSPQGPRSIWNFPAFPVRECTELSGGTPDTAQYNRSPIGHYPFQAGTGLSGGGGTRQSVEPSDHWMQLTWQIVVGCLHIGLSGAPRGPSGEL
jgi:hypothetical protein